jgi:hypothetical protein
VLWLLVVLFSNDVLQVNMIRQLHVKDQEQMNHQTNMASAYAMFLSADDI